MRTRGKEALKCFEIVRDSSVLQSQIWRQREKQLRFSPSENLKKNMNIFTTSVCVTLDFERNQVTKIVTKNLYKYNLFEINKTKRLVFATTNFSNQVLCQQFIKSIFVQ